jgi:uncharacterized protein DUF6069
MSTASLDQTTSAQSTWRRAAIAVVVVTIAASVANAVISLIAQAAGADTADYQGLTPAAYVSLTFLGTVAGVLAWIAVRAKADRPAVVLRRLVPAVVLVSLLADVAVGISVGWTGAIALGLMHVALAAIAVPVFRRALPLTR